MACGEFLSLADTLGPAGESSHPEILKRSPSFYDHLGSSMPLFIGLTLQTGLDGRGVVLDFDLFVSDFLPSIMDGEQTWKEHVSLPDLLGLHFGGFAASIEMINANMCISFLRDKAVALQNMIKHTHYIVLLKWPWKERMKLT